MKITLGVFEDSQDQLIKIKLDITEYDDIESNNYMPTHIIMDITDFYFNEMDLDITSFLCSQLILSQYIKSQSTSTLKCIELINTIQLLQKLQAEDVQEADLEYLDNFFVKKNTTALESPFTYTYSDETASKNLITIVYTLPTEPLLAFQLLSCLSLYFKQVNCIITFVRSASDHSTYNDFQNSPSGTKALVYLLESLLEIENSKYIFMQKALNSLNMFYSKELTNKTDKKPAALAKCIVEKHSLILWPITQTLITSAQPYYEKIQGLLFEVRHLLKADKQKELSQMLMSIHYAAKRALLEPSIGKKAQDNGVFHWKYTEFLMLLDKTTEFTLRSDGRIVLSHFKNTVIYSLYYNKEQENHEIFKDEMVHLFDCLGLQFEPSDFHTEMIFTLDSSKQLMDKGLHFTLSYVQNLIKVQNQAGFFKRHLPQIPQDASNAIALYSCDTIPDEDAQIILKSYQ